MSPTPYDNQVALWLWRGDGLQEKTIDDVCKTIRQQAPAVTALFVKTSDGSDWQGVYDTSAYRILGTQSVDLWVQTLAKYKIDFHAWCVPKGQNPQAEADKMIQVCKRPGVKSLIMDVEPYAGFFQGGRAAVRPLMTAVRAAIPGSFHIGMSVDPRPNHYNEIFPDEWFPFIGSIHPQVYWATFQQTPQAALDSTYKTWKAYGRPIFPVLQTDTDRPSMDTARQTAIRTQGAVGISWWRLGAIGTTQWAAVNVKIDGTVGVTPSGSETGTSEPGASPVDTGSGRYKREIVVKTTDPGYRDGTYNSTPTTNILQTFTNGAGWTTKFKPTSAATSTVWARWDPQLPEAGWYELASYVPGNHASTNNARFKLHNARGKPGEQEIDVAQGAYFDLWVPLGIFYFDTTIPASGVVFLNDLTGETGKEIAFDALRWREIIGIEPNTQFFADGFDAPIGVVAERRSTSMWPGQWIDVTGYATRYRIGTPQEAYHTGADLNLNEPFFDADAHSPIYAAASGVVKHVKQLSGWGRVIVIRHDPFIGNGQIVYGRYAHVESPMVQEGQRVVRGQQIARVGNAEGLYPYHLHFDISPTTILETNPGHWPKLNLNELKANYVDPRLFVSQHRAKG